MEYEIFTARSSNDLAAKVNLKINEGWQPLGGVAIRDDLFAQAAIRYRSSLTVSPTAYDYTTTVSLNEINQRMLAR